MKKLLPLFSCLLLVGCGVLTSAQADNDPLEPLNRRIGTWANTTYQKQAAWTPEERTTTGEETIKWILDKKFIQIDVINVDGTKGRSLITYDAEAKVYRSWFFGNQNEFPRGESIGRWDPKADRMDWTLDFGGDLRGRMFLQFAGKDKMDWALTIRDGSGKLMMKTGGSQTRKQ